METFTHAQTANGDYPVIAGWSLSHLATSARQKLFFFTSLSLCPDQIRESEIFLYGSAIRFPHA